MEIIKDITGNGETCSNCPPTISDENEIEEDETGEKI
jgi:hypothetical protein